MDTNASYQLTGRLDGLSAAGHQQALLALLAGEVRSITVDMARLDYISSAGLRVLLVVAKAALARGGGVVLRSPGPAVLEVLTISGFDSILGIQA